MQACVCEARLWKDFKQHTLPANMRAKDSGSSWHDLLLRVGSGEGNDSEGCISIPEDMLCHTDIVDKIHGISIDATVKDDLIGKAILAPKNSDVASINTQQNSNHQCLRRENL